MFVTRKQQGLAEQRLTYLTVMKPYEFGTGGPLSLAQLWSAAALAAQLNS